MLKPYFKPVVTRVELRPVEAVLTACKTGFMIHNVHGTGNDGCYTSLNAECLSDYGS